MSINRVCISGNLTRDCETRQTPSGATVAGFGVAVNERKKNNQTGEWEDYANFVDCVMFGTRAQAISQYLKKGSKVAIEGKLRYSSWERDGQKRSKLEVIVDDLEFMSRREEPRQQPINPQVAQAAHQAQAAYQNYSAPQFQEVSAFDEEIPF